MHPIEDQAVLAAHVRQLKLKWTLLHDGGCDLQKSC